MPAWIVRVGNATLRKVASSDFRAMGPLRYFPALQIKSARKTTMTRFKLSSLAQAVAICAGALLFAGNASAAGDKGTYDQAKASATAAYETDKKACDSLKGNANDICVAEAKAKRTRVDENAEAAYKGTPKAREHAIHEIADADYKVAKERCDDKAGNDKDVCVKEAKAMMTRTQADAKAAKKGTEARMDANQDKRDAEYKVATEKCDALAGDAKNSCVSSAKATFGK
jgi:hypothetical protein